MLSGLQKQKSSSSFNWKYSPIFFRHMMCNESFMPLQKQDKKICSGKCSALENWPRILTHAWCTACMNLSWHGGGYLVNMSSPVMTVLNLCDLFSIKTRHPSHKERKSGSISFILPRESHLCVWVKTNSLSTSNNVKDSVFRQQVKNHQWLNASFKTSTGEDGV